MSNKKEIIKNTKKLKSVGSKLIKKTSEKPIKDKIVKSEKIKTPSATILAEQEKKVVKNENEEKGVLENYDFLQDKKIKKLILIGKEKGFLTYDEINVALKETEIKVNSLEELYNVLDELNIKVLNSVDDFNKLYSEDGSSNSSDN
ncbi:MAG: RNA polymerase sigma factor region1.1 domain-containing protein, partial [Rickettsiales bacterium]|nr:RNA polymerase sigma factor region1.1 domain-containing protein [Rickettsiales bacterium]